MNNLKSAPETVGEEGSERTLDNISNTLVKSNPRQVTSTSSSEYVTVSNKARNVSSHEHCDNITDTNKNVKRRNKKRNSKLFSFDEVDHAPVEYSVKSLQSHLYPIHKTQSIHNETESQWINDNSESIRENSLSPQSSPCADPVSSCDDPYQDHRRRKDVPFHPVKSKHSPAEITKDKDPLEKSREPSHHISKSRSWKTWKASAKEKRESYLMTNLKSEITYGLSFTRMLVSNFT